MKSILLSLILILICAITSRSQTINIPTDYSTIQEAVNAAQEGDTVLVNEGTYYENVKIYGKAITLASHFLLDGDTSHINNTIIDGSKATNPDSASTIILLNTDTTTVIYGFTIQGGTGTFRPERPQFQSDMQGGGILMQGGKIMSNIIMNNHTSHKGNATGGGIEVKESDYNVIIRQNELYNNSNYSETIYTMGAGLSIGSVNGYVLVEENKIHHNTGITEAKYKSMGGGIGISQLTSCTGKVIIRNNHIYSNIVDGDSITCGGGIMAGHYYDTPPTELYPIEIYNNIISTNSSNNMGGGICTWYVGHWNYDLPIGFVISNNTFVNNSGSLGASVCNIDEEIVLLNNIFWNDMSDEKEIFNDDFRYDSGTFVGWTMDPNKGKVYSACNDVKDGWPGIGNIKVAPAFKTDSYELSDSSFCVGRGAESILVNNIQFQAPMSDFNGNNRINRSPDGRIDIGAIESHFEISDIFNSSTIQTVPKVYNTIQEAIDAAEYGDTILVDPGIYYENVKIYGKAITLASHFLIDGDTSHITNTIIDGSKPMNPDSASVITMFYTDTTTIVYGFTIQGGSGTYKPATDIFMSGKHGGGICLSGGKIIHNKITNNHIRHVGNAAGGGIDVTEYGLNLVIRENEIYGNTNYSDTIYTNGAGVNIGSSNSFVLVEGNSIHDNYGFTESGYKSMGGGLGITFFTSCTGKAIIRNNRIYNNVLEGDSITCGGGIMGTHYYDTPPTDLKPIEIYNNLIYNNSSQNMGGGICLWYVGYGHPYSEVDFVIMNNTIANNKGTLGAGLIAVDNKVALFNNVIWDDLQEWGNREVYDTQFTFCRYNSLTQWCVYSNTTKVYSYYNDIKLADNDSTNINCDPNFEEYKLSNNTSCIGYGVESIEIDGRTYYAPETDFYGNVRKDIADGKIDLGAIESDANQGFLCNPWIDQWLDIKEFHLSDEVNLLCYPNPSSGFINLEYDLCKEAYVLIEILDINGRKIATVYDDFSESGTHTIRYTMDNNQVHKVHNQMCLISLKTDTGIVLSKPVLFVNN